MGRCLGDGHVTENVENITDDIICGERVGGGRCGWFFWLRSSQRFAIGSCEYGPRSTPAGPSLGLGPLLRAMDRKDRRELGRLFQDAQAKNGGMSRDAREAMNTQLVQAVGAIPFDDVAVLAVMEAGWFEISRRSEVARKVWVEKVATMSPEARAELAESLLRGRK